MDMNLSKKRLTVIIPGYNTSDYCWRRCIASVMNAIGVMDEIIVVDDGSEPPVDLLRLGLNEDSRISLLRKGNGGLSSARNAALEIATTRPVTSSVSTTPSSTESMIALTTSCLLPEE